MTPQEQAHQKHVHDLCTKTISNLKILKTSKTLYPQEHLILNRILTNVVAIKKANNYLNNLQEKLKI